MKKKEQSSEIYQDNIKCTNINLMGVPERKKEKYRKKHFLVNSGQKLPKFDENVIHIQKGEQTPSKLK